MSQYKVVKPFGWNGRTLDSGEIVEIEQGSKTDALKRAKFIIEVENTEIAKIPALTTKPEIKKKPVSQPSELDASVVVYCLKCKEKKPLVDVKLVTLAHGRQAMQGKCSACGTKLHRMKKKTE